MDQSMLHPLNTSFLNESTITRSFMRHPSISQFCSPKHTEIQHFNSSFECTKSPFWPNQAVLCTHQEIYTPVTITTFKQIKSDQKIQEQQMNKAKRMTLPAQLLKAQMNHQPHLHQLPPQTKQPTRIKFTYTSSPPTSHHNLTPIDVSQSNVFPKPSKQITPRVNSIKILKHPKNKICSKEFAYHYSPLEQIRRKSQQLTSLLQSLQKQSQLLISRTFDTNPSKESNVTSAETSSSNITDPKRSEITNDSSRWHSQQKSASSRNLNLNMGADAWKTNLIDQIPTSKQLGKTIMIPSPAYDFGGLIASNKTISTNHNLPKPGDNHNQITRDWDQLKGLLSQGGDLKQSIHCGPDVRNNNFNCPMLEGFGREIKESTMSYQE